MSIKNRRGITLIEMLIATTMATVILAMAAVFIEKAIRWFQWSDTRNQMVTDARINMETINRFMQQGLASSIVICACGSDACAINCAAELAHSTPPNSRIQFDLAGGLPSAPTTYAIYWDQRQIKMQVTPPFPAVAGEPKTLGKDVTSILFAGDSTDPGLIYVTLRFDHSGASSKQAQNFMLPNQAVRMRLQ